MSKFKRIPYPQIKRAAAKMAEAVRPEKIILFGSYANGRPNADSDVDFLLVVKDRSRKQRHETSMKASRTLVPRPFPVDIVVRSADDIPWRIREGDFFLEDIIEKGRVLYEQPDR
ncbi:MAG: nucleotidyltransferase domain-containing protein [Elusimicrobia bacterium]|nr:nucleotidyltransferase domain-containing protein [Candidatus Obscuribacterium magneticum]MCB4755460.1 nucleotidyltransferase domain-containing protein [Candidatus Obscuribacterium magneticum]